MKRLKSPINTAPTDTLVPADLRISFIFKEGKLQVNQVAMTVLEGRVAGETFETHAEKSVGIGKKRLSAPLKRRIAGLADKILDLYAEDRHYD